MVFDNIFDDIPFFQQNKWAEPAVWILLIVILTFVIQVIIRNLIRKIMKSRDIEPHAQNAVLLMIRLLILMISASLILSVGGIPPDIIVAITAATGTVLGLASSRSIGNIFSGIWVLITQPYKVGDYIKLGGDTEGIIAEITLNYTKLLTPFGDRVIISNQQILDKQITNYRVILEQPSQKDEKPNQSKRKIHFKKIMGKKIEFVYRYPILVSFNSQNRKIATIHKIIDNTLNDFKDKFANPPNYEPFKRTHLEIGYAIYIYVKNPYSLFDIVPSILEKINIKIEDEFVD